MKNLIVFLSLFILLSCRPTTESKQSNSIPKAITTYRIVKNFDEDFQDLVNHGIGAIDIGVRYNNSDAILIAARKYNIKLLSRIEIPEIYPSGILTYQGLSIVDSSQRKTGFKQEVPESAVMSGGAYQGKAIDRFTFSFAAAPQTILLEGPIYHKENVYGDYGHYFPGIEDPEKVEIIVKQKNYDGKQHFQIIAASHKRVNDHHWEVKFDLSNITGDLDDVVISAYWIMHASLNKFRDNPTGYAKSTHEEMKRVVRDHITRWKEVNSGKYPDEIIALRVGDEEWHRSAHTSTSPEVSYPIWDYSETAIKEYEKRNPGEDYPRGQNFAHIFGRRAYANWFYSFHKSNTQIVAAIKEALAEEGLERIKVYRNITRGDVFSTQNDHDGTGLELLSQAFDIIHLDPYSVRRIGYTDDILVDMAYISGFARRFNKPLVPWLQAHQYYPEGYFGLTHPKPEEIEHMMNDHFRYSPDAIMWLGYGPGEFNTFPTMNPLSWEKAGKMHKQFKAQQTNIINPQIAIIRPYTVRALRDDDRIYPQDHFFTETILKDLILNKNIPFNPFEPLDLNALSTDDLKPYKLILAELGILNKPNLTTFLQGNQKTILFIEGCEIEDVASQVTGIISFNKKESGDSFIIENSDHTLSIKAIGFDKYELDDSVNILATSSGTPAIWQKGNIIFVATRGAENDFGFADFIWQVTKTEGTFNTK